MLLIYGANGYTGELISRRAHEVGLNPILAGRNHTAVTALASELGFAYRIFDLEDPAAIDTGLEGVTVVLHCAGPFGKTAEPMLEACLRTGTHYMDINGDIPVFEYLASRDRDAKRRGVMVLPGVGFDVVPTDMLAVDLKRQLPTATWLTLAIYSHGPTRISHGTALTSVEGLPRGGMVRRDGRLVSVPQISKSREFDFGGMKKTAHRIPWGDLFTAYWSTGIPNIEVYGVMPANARIISTLARWMPSVFAARPVQRLLKWYVGSQPAGPTAKERERIRVYIVGEARDENGTVVTSTVEGPDAYDWTAETSIDYAQHVLAGNARPGYHTPSELPLPT